VFWRGAAEKAAEGALDHSAHAHCFTSRRRGR
jgi:hypothetical protein